MNSYQRCNSEGSIAKQLYSEILLYILSYRNELEENKRKLQQENENLRNRIEDMEMQLEIYRLEQESQLEKKQKEKKQKEMISQHTLHEKQLERDRVFASHLLTEIWRDTITVSNEKDHSKVAQVM